MGYYDNVIVCPYCNGEEFVIRQKKTDRHAIMCIHCGREPYKANQIRRWK